MNYLLCTLCSIVSLYIKCDLRNCFDSVVMMNMIFQYITVAIIIIIVIVYVVSRVKGFKYKVKNGSAPCSSCALKEQCSPEKREDLKKCDQDIAK